MNAGALATMGLPPTGEGTIGPRELALHFQAMQKSAAGSVTAPMRQNTWVYSAITTITRAITSLDIKLVRGERDADAITSGPAYELLTNPAAGMTAEDLLEEVAGHLCEGGEAHVFDPEPTNIAPRELVVIGRRQMKPQVRKPDGSLLWWNYWPAYAARPVPIEPEYHAYIRMFNPYDPWRGLSPLEAAGLGISQDYRAAKYNDAALANGASPGGIYSFPGMVTREEREEYMQWIRERHEGEDNANRPMVLGGGADWKSTAFSNIDLALNEGRRMNREEIYAAIGVPPVLGNVFDSAHYNIADAAQEIFLLGTVRSVVQKIEGLFNTLILPRVEAGVMLVIDLWSHHVMQKIQQGKLESHAKALRNGVPYNESIAFHGLPFAEQPWGKQSFIEALETPERVIEGFDAFPASETTPPDDEETEGDTTDTPQETEGDEEESSAWIDTASIREDRKAEQRQIKTLVPTIRHRYRAFFIGQERRLVARLKRELKDRSGRRPWERAGDDDVERIAKRVLLNVTDEQRRLKRMMRGYFPKSVESTLRAELERLGIEASRIDKVIRQLKRGRFIETLLRIKDPKVARIEITTRARIRRQLVEGLRREETVQQLTDRVHSVVGGARARALTIARTEAGQAVSAARYLAAGAAGATGKGWLHGANPRASHLKAQQRYHPRENPIAMNEAFVVGNDRLMYPRDPSGSVGEIINCNCVMVTVRLKKDRDGSTVTEFVNATGALDWAPQWLRSAA